MTRASINRDPMGEHLDLYYKTGGLWDMSKEHIDWKKDKNDFRRQSIKRALSTTSLYERPDLHTTSDHKSSTSAHKSKPATPSSGQEDIENAWRFFGRETTFHGVKHIENERRGMYSRLVWFVLVLTVAGSLAYTVSDLLIEYYQYNTVTRTDITVSSQIPFPSITLCNACPYTNVDQTNTSALYQFVRDQSLFGSAYPVNYSDPAMLELLNTSVIDIQNKYSIKVTDFLFLPQFQEQDINVTDVFEVTETFQGRCFTFNGPRYIAQHGVLQATDDGRHSGLRIYVDLRQKDYFVYDDTTAGVRMHIANYPDTPRLEKDGIDLHPGTATRVALSPVKFKFLPKPYSSYGTTYCTNADQSELLDKMINASVYSYDGCQEQCLLSIASHSCNCYTHILYLTHLPPCTLQQLTQCIFPHRENFDYSQCDCPRPCSFTRFDVTMSASQLPSRESALYLRNFTQHPDIASLREDFLELRVFMETMLTRQERHEPQFTFNSIFAFLGGQMGFFMGASLITLAELSETILVSAYIFVKKIIIGMGHTRTAIKAKTIKVQPAQEKW